MKETRQSEQRDMSPLWLTYRQAQRLSGLGRTTLWTLVRSDKIKAAHVGRAVRIDRRSLEEFLEAQANQPRLPGFDDFE